MKKNFKFLLIFTLSASVSLNVVAFTNNSESQFNYKNLLTSKSLQTMTQDQSQFNYKNLLTSKSLQTMTQDQSTGDLYFATFDDSTGKKNGEKIWKYDIKTKAQTIYWEDKNFRIGSFNMAIDSQGTIYLASAGGVVILNNKNQFIQMSTVTGAITNLIYFKNNVYVISIKGFYKYNITTKLTTQIALPDNSIANSIFIDKNENIYLGIYKSVKYGAVIIKKGEIEALPIVGDDFFNTNGAGRIAEINNKIYFCSINYENKKSKLYENDLDNLKTNYLLDIDSSNLQIFNINNEVALSVQENDDWTIQVLSTKDNIKFLKKIYEIKNIFYIKTIKNLKNLYLLSFKRDKIDFLSW